MSNFPAAWVSGSGNSTLLGKIRDLLGKFGVLEQIPTISRTGGTVSATATFIEASAAEQAAQSLHNVDNRTAAEKTRCNHAPPKEHERFCVRLLSSVRSAGASAPLSSGHPPARTVRLREVPTEWSLSDVRELCAEYGKVESSSADGGPGGFLIRFATHEAAVAAQRALHGMQMQSEVGFNRLVCVLVAEAAPSSLVEKPVAKGEEASGPPLFIFIDEIRLASGAPNSEDREIFLRDLPYEDYSEKDLHEWLANFGAVDRVCFLKDPLTKQLTGRGYVRFSTHEEAVGLLAAFPEEDEEGNAQGTWSLSERLTRQWETISGAVSKRLQGLAASGGCSLLGLAGGGRCLPAPPPPALSACGSEGGPLHFAAWPRERLQSDSAALRKQLAVLVSELVDGVPEAKPAPAPSPALAAPPLAEAEEPKGPCVVVRNFPDSWTEKQVRLVFALFGGVASVRFVRGAFGGRVAHVELKTPENMPKAVEQLHNTQVGDGDLIEECSISCEMVGVPPGGDSTRSGARRRVLFLDELPMPKRPQATPGPKDREVFLAHLPVQECNETQIQDWLEGFGKVEDMFLLREQRTGEYTGRGYARFRTHEEAKACVEAQGPSTVEEGDVVAMWSESERGSQRERSVYGADLQSALVSGGRVLPSGIGSRLRELWLLGEAAPRGRAPKAEGKQLHILAECDDRSYEELRSALVSALAAFHDKVGAQLREGARATPAASPQWRSPPRDSSAWQHPPQAHAAPPRSWYDWQRPHENPYARPPGPPGWYGAGFGALAAPQSLGAAAPRWPGQPQPGQPQPGQPPGPQPVPGYQPPPAGQAPAPSAAEQRRGSPERKRRREEHRGRRERDRDGARQAEAAAAAESLTGDALEEQVAEGEALIAEGKALKQRGSGPKAYDKYCKGLRILLDVIARLGEEKAQASSLRERINSYLDEAETLKHDARPDPEPAVAEQPQRGESRGAVASAAPAPQSRHASRSGRGQPTAESSLRARVDQGQALIAEGSHLEASNQLDKAYERYCQGLQYLLEVMPKLKEDASFSDVRSKIAGYLAKAEALKERLEAREHREEARAPRAEERREEGARRSSRRPPSSRRDEEGRRERHSRGLELRAAEDRGSRHDGRHGRRAEERRDDEPRSAGRREERRHRSRSRDRGRHPSPVASPPRGLTLRPPPGAQSTRAKAAAAPSGRPVLKSKSGAPAPPAPRSKAGALSLHRR